MVVVYRPPQYVQIAIIQRRLMKIINSGKEEQGNSENTPITRHLISCVSVLFIYRMSLSVVAQLDEPKVRQMSKQELELRNLTKTFTGIEKPLKNAPVVNTLPDLIQELHRVFEQDRVNIEYVNHLMLSYQSNPNEWKKFAKFDRYRYTRNLVDAGNGKFNLMILCWGPGHGSAIHDHADSHCLMKMLSGQLSEVRYAWPKAQGSLVESGEIFNKVIDNGNDDDEGMLNGEELEETSRYTLDQNEVCYINGECVIS